MDNSLKIGERLTDLMIESEIGNRKLANAINVDITTIQCWKRGAKFMYLGQIIKLANYFNCSLDFLTGRSDTVIDFKPKECPPFYPQFRKVMAERGKTRYSMDKETKIKDSYFTNWSKGKEPHIFSLIEVANYLDVSLDYLVGRD